MILLTSTSDKLQLVTSGAQQVWVHASYVDLNGTTITPGRKNTSVASATTTDIVGAPGSSTTRNIKSLIISNQDAATATTVTVQHTDGTTVPVLTKMVLQPGSTLVFSENMGWEVMDNQGGLGTSPATGRLLKINVFTGGTTFTSSSQTKSIRVRMVAGGGGGGGCTSVSSAASCAGGGGAGGYAEKVFAVTPSTAYTYAVGSAGAGNSGAGGGNGGNSTFAVGATTVTANGGTGGPAATSTITTGTGFAGGNGGAISTNGDVNGAGAPGGAGVMTAVTPLGRSGEGGSGPFGKGGLGLVAAAAGNAADGFGGGGGGAMTGTAAARAGGAGTAGLVIVEEYT